MHVLTKSAQLLIVLLAVLAAYIWLLTPVLRPFSLQAFAFSLLLYFALKFWQRSKPWHLLPDYLSPEIGLASFAFLLLIGDTGNTSSMYWSLTYVHLFFLVFSTDQRTAIMGALAITLFHYALLTSLTPLAVINLLSVSLMTLFFLFAKAQYDEVLRDQTVIKKLQGLVAELSSEEQSVTNQITDQILPQLSQVEVTITKVSNHPHLTNQLAQIKSQLTEVARLFQDSNYENTQEPDASSSQNS